MADDAVGASVTVTKPPQVEWVPISFALVAAYIVTVMCFVHVSDVTAQAAAGIAQTLAGAAAGVTIGGNRKTATVVG